MKRQSGGIPKSMSLSKPKEPNLAKSNSSFVDYAIISHKNLHFFVSSAPKKDHVKPFVKTLMQENVTTVVSLIAE